MIFFGYGFTVELSGDTWIGVQEELDRNNCPIRGERFHALRDFINSEFDGLTVFRLAAHHGDLTVIAVAGTVQDGPHYVVADRFEMLPSEHRELMVALDRMGLSEEGIPHWMSWA